jgi:ribosomal protein S18 acetylase RimI-like enzyme
MPGSWRDANHCAHRGARGRRFRPPPKRFGRILRSAVTPLDNPVHAALTTAHARLAIRRGEALRYPLAVARYAAPGAFDDLAAITAPGERLRLFSSGELAVPAPWRVELRQPLVQMLSRHAIAAEHDVEPLGAADVGAMLELAALTRPGPFFARTIELGRYVGIRADGRLVAMAGERLRLAAFTEISAVCTHPDYRGRGYGRSLVAALVNATLADGRVPFLHVTPSNDARRLYERLGFETRAAMQVTVIAHSIRRGLRR